LRELNAGILKNAKREEVPDAPTSDDRYDHLVFDNLDFDLFDLTIDDQLFDIFDNEFFSEDAEGESLDLSFAQTVPPVQNSRLQRRANTIPTISETPPSPDSTLTIESRDQLNQHITSALGLEQIILSVAIFALLKNAWQVFERWPGPHSKERHGKWDTFRPRAHARDWQTTNDLSTEIED
jgi:hypothetical protein